MITSIIITPKFLESVSENKEITEALNEFRAKYSHDFFKEVMVLVIDKELEYIEKYKSISKLFGEKNIYLKYFIEDFILRLKRERANINSNSLQIDIFLDKIIDLKNFPKISAEPYCSFPISEDKLKIELKKLTQFAKEIYIFDPYISQHMTNYSKTGIKEINDFKKNISKSNFENFKIKIQQNQGYKYSLRQIIKIIFDLNKSNKIDIKIFSTIRKDDKKNFDYVLENLQKEIVKFKMNKDNPEKLELLREYYKSIQSQLFDFDDNPIIAKKITEIISKCFDDLKDSNKSIEFKILQEWSNENKFYKRGLLIYGEQIKIAVDFGQGLNIFFRSLKSKKTFKLQNNPEYHLKIITNKHEKQKYSSITRFEEYNKNLKIAVNS